MPCCFRVLVGAMLEMTALFGLWGGRLAAPCGRRRTLNSCQTVAMGVEWTRMNSSRNLPSLGPQTMSVTRFYGEFFGFSFAGGRLSYPARAANRRRGEGRFGVEGARVAACLGLTCIHEPLSSCRNS